MMTMAELAELLAKIGLAALLAGAVGVEREWTGKWAGLRTHMLIAVGSTLLAHVSVHLGDGGRIAAQIVTGVGFLGAGTIIQSRGAVRGLTTAAGLWVAAAIGIAIGCRFYGDAIVVTIALLVILVALRPVERRLHHEQHAVVVQLDSSQKLGDLIEVLDEGRIEVEHLERHRDDGTVLITFRGSHSDHQRLLDLCGAEGFNVRDDRPATPSSMMAGPT
jgi:putative Mg2+ transporter-C (MgtC) family protein